MGRQVIRQPNGELAMWSSIVDSFVIINCDKERMLELLAKEAAQEVRRVWGPKIDQALKAGTSGHGEFALTWEEAQEIHTQIHGSPFDPANPDWRKEEK